MLSILQSIQNQSATASSVNYQNLLQQQNNSTQNVLLPSTQIELSNFIMPSQQLQQQQQFTLQSQQLQQNLINKLISPSNNILNTSNNNSTNLQQKSKFNYF